MKAAIYDTKKITLVHQKPIVGVDHKVTFVATGRTLVFDGWLKLLSDDPTQEKKKDQEQTLPDCREGEVVAIDQINLVAKSTKPPPRFTVASLIKTLEKSGVGRPSTYADILSGLVNKQYVTVSKKLFIPTETGKLLIDLVTDAFCFANVEFTNQMENKLDQLAKGKADYAQVVNEFHSTLSLEIQAFDTVQVNTTKMATVQQEAHKTYDCPECDGQLSRIKGGKGFFWGCSNYKQGCKHTAKDNRGKPQAEHKCPNCEPGKLRRIKGSNGFFWGCSNYKEGCKTTFQDKRGKPQWEK